MRGRDLVRAQPAQADEGKAEFLAAVIKEGHIVLREGRADERRRDGGCGGLFDEFAAGMFGRRLKPVFQVHTSCPRIARMDAKFSIRENSRKFALIRG